MSEPEPESQRAKEPKRGRPKTRLEARSFWRENEAKRERELKASKSWQKENNIQ